MIDDSSLDSLYKETYSEMHDLALHEAARMTPQDFDTLLLDSGPKTRHESKNFYNKNSLIAVAASVVLIISLAVPAVNSWRGGTEASELDRVKTAANPTQTSPATTSPETQTSVPTTNSDGTPVTTSAPGTDDNESNDVPLVTSTTTPTESPSTTTTVAPNPTIAPTGFWAYTNEKYPGYWKVKFSWNPSITPGVSYCVSDSLSEVQNCEYDAGLTPTWQNLNRAVGDTALHTYYITAVTPAGVVSEAVSTTYAIPA